MVVEEIIDVLTTTTMMMMMIMMTMMTMMIMMTTRHCHGVSAIRQFEAYKGLYRAVG